MGQNPYVGGYRSTATGAQSAAIGYQAVARIPRTMVLSGPAIVRNTAPSSGGAPGWACTTAGAVGTWKAEANLA